MADVTGGSSRPKLVGTKVQVLRRSRPALPRTHVPLPTDCYLPRHFIRLKLPPAAIMGASEHPTVAVAEIPPSWDRFSSLGMEVLSAPYASQLAEDGEAQNPSPDGLQRSIFLDPRNLESATEAQLKPTIEQAEDSSIAAEPAICQQDEEPSGSAADQRQSDKPADSHSAAETLNRLRTTLKLEGSQGMYQHPDGLRS